MSHWFKPRGPLRPISAAEGEILSWLIHKPGLLEADIVEAQLKSSVVHEIEPARYMEFFTKADAPPLHRLERGVYVTAYAPIDEIHGIEALIHVLNFRVFALEFSFSPAIAIPDISAVKRWEYL